MEEFILGSEIISALKNNIIVIGYGKKGRRLEEEFNLLGFNDYRFFIAEEDTDISPIKNPISWEELIRLIKAPEMHIVIVDDDCQAIKDVLEDRNIKYYKYISETYDEKVARLSSKGIFNGENYTRLKNRKEAVPLLMKYIEEDRPFLYSRWGDSEAFAYISSKTGVGCEHNMRVLYTNAGVFPNNIEALQSFSEEFEKAAKQIDIFCTFSFVPLIDVLYQRLSEGAEAVNSDLEYPFFDEYIWTKALSGKKVLVCHPFAKLIEEQYKNRDKIWNNGALPTFANLIVYKSVQSMGGNENYSSWMDALEKMKSDISELDFDIALIGCGAYGMPLGAFIKEQMNKKAIHLGGSLQILFGIKGKRWEGETYQYDKKLYNEYWKRPYEEDKPANWENVENGCYW